MSDEISENVSDGNTGEYRLTQNGWKILGEILKNGWWDWMPTYSKFDMTLGTLNESIRKLKKEAAFNAQNNVNNLDVLKLIEALENAKEGIEDSYAKVTDAINVFEEIISGIEEVDEYEKFDDEFIQRCKGEADI